MSFVSVAHGFSNCSFLFFIVVHKGRLSTNKTKNKEYKFLTYHQTLMLSLSAGEILCRGIIWLQN